MTLIMKVFHTCLLYQPGEHLRMLSCRHGVSMQLFIILPEVNYGENCNFKNIKKKTVISLLKILSFKSVICHLQHRN